MLELLWDASKGAAPVWAMLVSGLFSGVFQARNSLLRHDGIPYFRWFHSDWRSGAASASNTLQFVGVDVAEQVIFSNPREIVKIQMQLVRQGHHGREETQGSSGGGGSSSNTMVTQKRPGSVAAARGRRRRAVATAAAAVEASSAQLRDEPQQSQISLMVEVSGYNGCAVATATLVKCIVVLMAMLMGTVMVTATTTTVMVMVTAMEMVMVVVKMTMAMTMVIVMV